MTATGSERGVERFREHLQMASLPVTSQRLRIARLVFNTHHHVSADEIMERLRVEGEAVGKATVYRTLALLARRGAEVSGVEIIREHDFGEGFRRYEPSPTRPDHEHLVCTRCGKVIEFEAPEIAGIESEIADRHRFLPNHHKVEIYGLCEECHD